MPEIPLDPQSITPAWLSKVLQADVHACDIEQIAEGVGLLGRLFRARLEGGPGVPATVVVKMPTLNTTLRNEMCEPGDFYLREVRFYQQIGLANPLPPARPYFAAIDEATHDFVLVLEDVSGRRLADQTVGCAVADAETMVDELARHHAHWWDNESLASLDWLTSFNGPPMSDVVVANFKVAWPTFLERMADDVSPAMRDFGERFPSMVQWYLDEVARPPVTFLHGDLRLDQLFFAVTPDDPPVTVLDWQIAGKGRGAYDVGYFLSQSLPVETRRNCEDGLIERYSERLAERGIDYPREQLRRDYRLAVAMCFAYPVLGAGRVDVANDRQMELLRTMLNGAAAAIEDHDCFSLRPD